MIFLINYLKKISFINFHILLISTEINFYKNIKCKLNQKLSISNLTKSCLELFLVISNHLSFSYFIQMLMKNQKNSSIISLTLLMYSVHMIMLLTSVFRLANAHKLLVSSMLKLHQLSFSHKPIKRFIKDMNLLKILD